MRSFLWECTAVLKRIEEFVLREALGVASGAFIGLVSQILGRSVDIWSHSVLVQNTHWQRRKAQKPNRGGGRSEGFRSKHTGIRDFYMGTELRNLANPFALSFGHPL